MGMISNKIVRFCKHLAGPGHVRKHFPPSVLKNIEHAIRETENTHNGELRFVIEAALHPYALWQGETPRQRAIELFAKLGIWDTEHNNGVLIYLLLADHDVEIVADRGIHGHVGPEGWEAICRRMETAFRKGEFEAGMLAGIREIGVVLQKHFPANGSNKNELPDEPLVV
jgi:uncharacterized membrane protein